MPFGTPDPSPEPQEKQLDSRRVFLGLDKCNACTGISICKKFERWLTAQSNLSSADVRSYEGNFTNSTAGWRPVVLSYVMSPHLHQTDNSICTSVGKGKSCSTEAVLRATSRFQSWVRSNLLLPSMVKVCIRSLYSDVYLRSAVAQDLSVQMKHFSQKDKLGLLYTLAVNQQPLILQQGWAFSRWADRSCFFAEDHHARTASRQWPIGLSHLLKGAGVLRFENHCSTPKSGDMFGTLHDNGVFIVDASTIGIFDLQEMSVVNSKHLDVFSGLSGSCERPPTCETVRAPQSFILLCKHVINNLLVPNDVQSGHLPKEAVSALAICADQSQHLRPCSSLYGYRYP
uniref:Divergent protein kinase domain 2B n=1 Tax=Cyprinus carpio TaxID=7962 RepID=A0A8C1N263_CYPCA